MPNGLFSRKTVSKCDDRMRLKLHERVTGASARSCRAWCIPCGAVPGSSPSHGPVVTRRRSRGNILDFDWNEYRKLRAARCGVLGMILGCGCRVGHWPGLGRRDGDADRVCPERPHASVITRRGFEVVDDVRAGFRLDLGALESLSASSLDLSAWSKGRCKWAIRSR